MKVISLLQPWASLVVLGHKKIETRSWNTKYRGPLLIHASTKWAKDQEQLAHQFFQMLQDSRIYHCPRGAIIGHVQLKEAVRFSDCKVGNYFSAFEGYHTQYTWDLTEQEIAFGDYSDGRYGWLLADPISFDEPIPAKGALSIWEYKEPITNG